MVGAGQFAVQGLGRGEFAAVAGEDCGEDGDRVDGGEFLVGCWLVCGQGGVFAVQAFGAVEFGGGAAAGAGVSCAGVARYAIGVIGVAAPAHGDVQSLAVAESVDQDVGGAGGAAERGVAGGRVGEGGMLREVAGGYLERRRPAGLAGGRVAAGEPAHFGVAAAGPGGGAGDLQDVAVGQVPAVLAGLDAAGVAAGHDQVPGAGLLALGEADGRAVSDEAVADQVVAGAAG